MYQKTIKTSSEFQSIGIRFGQPIKMILSPAPPNTGIVFNERVEAIVKNSFVSQHTLGLRKDKTKIYLTEHLLAACYGLGVDNLLVSLSGKEVPFGDGSALPFVQLIRRAGINRYQAKSKIYNLPRPLIVHWQDSFIFALPAKRLQINCLTDFPQIKPSMQFWGKVITITNFVKDLAPARTFGPYPNQSFLKKYLPFKIRHQAGFILPKVFRHKKEMVCHKVLDLLGHLVLLNFRLNAKIFVFKPSHHLSQIFIQQIADLQ